MALADLVEPLSHRLTTDAELVADVVPREPGRSYERDGVVLDLVHLPAHRNDVLQYLCRCGEDLGVPLVTLVHERNGDS